MKTGSYIDPSRFKHDLDQSRQNRKGQRMYKHDDGVDFLEDMQHLMDDDDFGRLSFDEDVENRDLMKQYLEMKKQERKKILERTNKKVSIFLCFSLVVCA